MSLRVYSHLISSRDNALLFNLLGPKCSAMASAVAQLYVASMESRGRGATWSCKGSGVVCLVNDKSLSSYFLRLYSVKKAKLLWEQELYIPFRYTAPCPYFHTFPADDFQAGLNFADEEEAERFLSAVKTRIKSIQNEGRKTFSGLHENTQDSPCSSAELTLGHTAKPSSEQFLRSMSNKSDTKLPSNFNLMNYSSNNPEKSFDGSTLDLAQQKVLAKAEISGIVLKCKQSSINNNLTECEGKPEAAQKDFQAHQPQSLPKCRCVFSSLAQRKGPLPPLPVQSVLHPGREPQSVPQNSHTEPFPATLLTPEAIPPPPSTPAPRLPPGHPALIQLSATNWSATLNVNCSQDAINCQ